MTIEKGKDWGAPGEVPVDTPVARSDAELSNLFSVDDGEGRTLTGPSLVVLLPNTDSPRTPRESTNGLAMTLGARGTIDSVLGSTRTLLPIDLGVVTLDAESEEPRRLVMSSSLLITGALWSGVTEAAMNAAFLDTWNVTPNGHPNDGRFDVVRAELGLADRFKARKRLATGSHVPHPNISVRRLKRAEFRPAPSSKVWIDGKPMGRVELIEVTVVPDAVTLAI